MKFLVKCIGGSTAYGLNTPESDIDYRGVFVNTNPAEIVGLDRFDVVQKQETDDIVYYEVRRFFELLKEGNTGALEILFNENFIEVSDEFEEVKKFRTSFIDVDRMYKCLLGYMQGERRLANGERTGQLGSKRKAQLDKYGFSPKNATQLLRLAFCGNTLFHKGYFPVNVKTENVEIWEKLMSVKTTPEKYTKAQLNLMFDSADESVKQSYITRSFFYQFDKDKANDLLRRIYLPYLR